MTPSVARYLWVKQGGNSRVYVRAGGDVAELDFAPSLMGGDAYFGGPYMGEYLVG